MTKPRMVIACLLVGLALPLWYCADSTESKHQGTESPVSVVTHSNDDNGAVTAFAWQCGIDGCPGGEHSAAYTWNGACGAGNPNKTLCEANITPNYWKCGIDECAGGWHSTAYVYNSGCVKPGSGAQNKTNCTENSSDYWACGDTCPTGSVTGSIYNSGCVRPGSGNPNKVHCVV
jgi:hypothetical protein